MQWRGKIAVETTDSSQQALQHAPCNGSSAPHADHQQNESGKTAQGWTTAQANRFKGRFKPHAGACYGRRFKLVSCTSYS